MFCAGRQRRCCGSAICASGVVVLRCFAWNARATVCSSVIVVGPVVQAVRLQICKKSIEIILALQSCASFLNAAHVAERARVIVRASHVAGVCAVLGGLS